MAEIDQEVALQAKPPQFDLSGALDAYNRYRLGGAETALYGSQANLIGTQADLAQMRLSALQNYMGGQNAGSAPGVGANAGPGGSSDALRRLAVVDPQTASSLMDVNARINYANSGDPSALRIDPQAFEQISNATKNMTESKIKDFELQSDAVGRAAAKVSAIPEGPERAKAWDDQLTQLYQNGTIHADAMKRLYGNYSPLVLDQAIRGSQNVKDYFTMTGRTAGAEAAAKLPFTPHNVPEGSTEMLGANPLLTAGKAVQGVDQKTGTGYQTFTAPPLTTYGPASGHQAGPLAPYSSAQPAAAAAPQPAPATNGVAATSAQNGTPSGIPAGAVVTKLGPAAEEEQSGQGKNLVAFGKEIQDRADNAVQQNYLYDSMEREAQSWRQGKFATVQNDARAYLKGAAEGLGLDPGKVIDKQVPDFESFQKNAGQVVREAVRATSARAAVQEFSLIQKALPSADMSQGGFEQVINQLRGVNDYHLATNQAAQNWRNQNNGSLAGFQQDWQSNITPAAFFMARLTPDQRQSVATDIRKTPQGDAALSRIMDEIRYGQKQGLFQ